MRKHSGSLIPFLVAASLSTAQAPPPSPDNQTILKQTVNNVLVDIVVTDKNGQPIQGLTKDQFHITENSAPQTIAFFEEHNDAPVANTPAPPAPLQLPPNVYSNFQSAPARGPLLILLMDSLNTPLADQAKVRLAMLQYLHQIPPGIQIAIFALNEHLSMVQGFNTDPAVLTAALKQLDAKPKQSRLTDDPGHDSYADSIPKPNFGGGGSSGIAAEAQGLQANYVANEGSYRADARMELTLATFGSLATYLGALPGRKSVIWFSGSFPLAVTTQDTIRQGQATLSTSISDARNYSDKVTAASKMLDQARAAIYPVLAGGPSVNSHFDVDRQLNGAPHNSPTDPNGVLERASTPADDEISAHETMNVIADQTGGRAFYSSTDLGAAIRSVQQLGAHYYTIAYAPTNTSYDGKFRKIAIKVDSPKARLDYRRGYFAEDPTRLPSTARMPAPTEVSFALLHGAPSSTQILFKLRATPKEDAQPAANAATTPYSINWTVDLHGIPFTQQADGSRKGAFSLVLVAYDTAGKLLNQAKDGGDIALDPAQYQKYLASGLQFHQEIDLPSGYVFLRAAIVDESGNRSGSIEIPLNVAPPHQAGK
ncbi:VWA domain-containing protein [Terracidiphilus gabretensis]|uniref:VWA domain-containing protein n=1 Tax=Terracidiphilus gabretensis TaxID=1577687 RepID=UPI00071BDB7E|nr:VWA domain-containing protein [Terracidiphilus gabretensis]